MCSPLPMNVCNRLSLCNMEDRADSTKAQEGGSARLLDPERDSHSAPLAGVNSEESQPPCASARIPREYFLRNLYQP